MMMVALLAMALHAAPGDEDLFLDDMAFDLFGDTEEVLQRQQAAAPDQSLINRRRTMLTLHQGFGLATIAAMAATTVLGELNIQDTYAPDGGRSGRFLLPHRVTAYGTTALFLSSAALSLLAPTPFEDTEKKTGIDTATMHRIAVALASAGMVAQIALGIVAGRRADAGNSKDLGAITQAHRVVGFSTLGALSVAAVVWVF